MSAFLPGKLAAWMAAHPAVQIETEERTSADIVSCILAGVAQAGVVSDAVDPGPLRLDPVADDPLVLIVPPAHPLAEKRKWRLRRCSTSRWSPSIRPVRYSSISNSTQLNSARR
jgi:DNA-binding transcriptional LysR family regulator